MPDELSEMELEVRTVIEREGPISVSDYMNLCLTHPKYGYYTSGHPLGGRASGGDFITAPEISQMFGELIGVWCMEVWLTLGKPAPFNLTEMGPGRGTLMKDLLRAARAMPEFLQAARVHLVEISPTLAEQQSLNLSDSIAQITWLTDISALPASPTIVIGNEFLDALPIHQWIKTDDNWLERGIEFKNERLDFTTRSAMIQAQDLPAGNEGCPTGSIFETSPEREKFVEALANRLTEMTGAALFIDYGHLRSGFGDTFQAVHEHAFSPTLEKPGKVDLTSHVDFEPLVETARLAGCDAPLPVSQRNFLTSLGLLERAGALGAGRSTTVHQTLQDAVERLAGPDKMGELFKVMAFGSPDRIEGHWPGFG